MDRLTKKYVGGYGLVKVKDNEQDLESPYPNTLRACFESWQMLGAYEDTGLTPAEVEALKQREQFLTEAYDRQATIHEALTRDYLAVKSERDRFKARAEAAEKDIARMARGLGDVWPCWACENRCFQEYSEDGTCNGPGFEWRGPQEGANP